MIYRQFKPVYWSPSSGTALAEAELEYDENHTSTAAFVKLPLTKIPHILRNNPAITPSNIHALIWTTTPWTLPANRAIAVNSGLEYVVMRCVSEGSQRESVGQLLVAQSRVDYIRAMLGSEVGELETLAEHIPGSDLVGSTFYVNPLRGKSVLPQPILHADFVTASAGSGLVHMAPGHGMDDFGVCAKHGIDPSAPVDDHGRFTQLALPDNPDILRGKPVQAEGTMAVLEYLRRISSDRFGEKNMVLRTHDIKHKYPLDWRTKKPIIIRATEQWFADVGGLKDSAIRALDDVRFVPDAGKSRLRSFVNGRSEWCISRQRAWGVPIPALFHRDGGISRAVMTGDTIEHIIRVISERGVDAWWTDPEDHPAWIPAGLEGDYYRGKDTLDVWFDSGTTWTLLPTRSDGKPLADVYLEGTDQHRGWFQSSLLSYIAHQTDNTGGLEDTPRAPFATLITHGFTLDQEGRKMSKSVGNVISPVDIINGSLLPPLQRKRRREKHHKPTDHEEKPTYDALGVDALRLWVASSDYTKDVVIGQAVLHAVNLNLHKYRITFRWLLGVLQDYDPRQEPAYEAQVTHSKERLMDRIALWQLRRTAAAVHSAYKGYEVHKAVNLINSYIGTDLSAFYFETLKDRLYAGSLMDRHSAQTVLARILDNLLLMLAPVTPVLVEEVHDHAPPQLLRHKTHSLKQTWDPHDTSARKTEDSNDRAKEERLDRQISHLVAAHDAIKQAQETARAAKKMGSGLECDVSIDMPDDANSIAKSLFRHGMEDELAAIFVVSRVDFTTGEATKGPAAGLDELDGGCWSVEASFDVGSASGGPAKAIVKPASGKKCPRCWQFQAPRPDELCRRCDEVVREAGHGE